MFQLTLRPPDFLNMFRSICLFFQGVVGCRAERVHLVFVLIWVAQDHVGCYLAHVACGDIFAWGNDRLIGFSSLRIDVR